jgi:succinoglycan biosynthesis protein ExoO
VSTPEVSVIIAAWKAESFLERAVRSALASQGVSVEVIIVDDASPDGTSALAQKLAGEDTRIIAERLAANGGPSAARNRAIARATGRYISILDADDAMTTGRLAAMVKHAEATDADIIVDNMVEVNEAGERLGTESFLTSDAFALNRTIDLATWVSFNEPMKRGDCIGYLKPLIRREALLRVGARYDSGLRNSEDYYLVADLLADGLRMEYLASAGYLYTRSVGSTSHRLKPEHTQAWLDAEKRFANRHGARLSPADRKTLSRRTRALRNVHNLVATTDAVKARRLSSAVGVMASDINGAIFTLGVFARIAMGKVLGRKLV